MGKRRNKGTGSLYLRSGIWYLRIQHKGQEYRESTHCAKREDAERILRARLTELDTGLSLSHRQTVFADLALLVLQNYRLKERKTLADQFRRFDVHILPVIGAVKAIDLSSSDVSVFIAARRNKGASNGEINRELALIKRAYNLGRQQGLISCETPYFEMMKEARKRVTYWKDGEFNTLLKHLPEILHPIVTFLKITGWRVSEAKGLEWRNVDFERREVKLFPQESKSGEPRIFPFLPELEVLLTEQHEKTVRLEKATDSIIPYVFHRNGRKICNFEKEWYAALEAGKLVGKKRHDFRSTAARALVKLGVHPMIVCKMVGWESLDMLRYYLIIDAEDVHEAVAKIRESAAHKGTHKGTG